MNKRTKQSRYRASKTHGCGSMKKRRGAGNRGGKGAAGSGKRADSKKPVVWGGKYFGKYGFTSKSRKSVCGINVGALDQQVSGLVAAKQVTQENGVYVVDLAKLGYTKLLGDGLIKSKCKITVSSATPKASEKVKAAGGEVVSKPAEVPKEQAVAEEKKSQN